MTPFNAESLTRNKLLSAALMAGLGREGHWTGELSASALSTATVVDSPCRRGPAGECALYSKLA